MNNKYTTQDNPDVDRFVENQLDIVVHSLCGLMGDDLKAIVLTGGFGRSEGSVMIEPTGLMHAVNDYDIEVVYSDKRGVFLSKLIMHLRYKKKLEVVEKKLASQLGIKQVDLTLRGEQSYSGIENPKLADYDLKYGHKLLYGKADPVDLMRPFQSREIPLYEATWLFRNRGIGLLLAYLYINNGRLAESKKENFYIEINKAILAMGDALFIKEGKYICSYKERALNIQDVIQPDYEYMKELLSLYPVAANYKLNPQENMYPGMSPIQIWHKVNELYQSLFLYFESYRLKKTFNNISDYAEWVSNEPRLNYKQYAKLYFLKLTDGIEENSRFLSLKVDRSRNILFIFSLLASCDEINDITACNNLIKQLSAIHGKELTKSNRNELVKRFLLLIHPSGEVGRFLENS
ncbi:MAG: hypothetical protein OEW87_14250 [Flavobacteriaceae bacterium]|nr:hypothetical protein [Flavobacteriaceae bacterium]